MSTEIFPEDEREPERTAHNAHEVSPHQLYVTSFFGGVQRGRMLQFTPRSDLHYSQLQRAEVEALVLKLNQWLEETAPVKLDNGSP